VIAVLRRLTSVDVADDADDEDVDVDDAGDRERLSVVLLLTTPADWR